jgi:hypothetical protein
MAVTLTFNTGPQGYALHGTREDMERIVQHLRTAAVTHITVANGLQDGPAKAAIMADAIHANAVADEIER